MIYSKEFIEKVKRVYPDNTLMHKAAEGGNAFLGRYLDDNISSISLKRVLNADSLEELKEYARKIQAKHDLYNEWWDLYRKECEPN